MTHEKSSNRMQVPKISEEQLQRLFAQISPLVRDKCGNARLIKEDELRGVSYIWNPKYKGKPVENLHDIGEFRCLHRYGYYGCFKPSIAEVLCQIPANMAARATHFEIVKHPETSHDLAEESEALNAGFHVSTVRVYGH